MIDTLKQQFIDAFTKHAPDGIARFKNEYPDSPAPRLSHVCFKFKNPDSYGAYVASARTLGTVTQETFKGKQISWCKLNAPLQKGGLTLEWLELVEPRFEQNDFDGVTSIGYCVPNLPDVVKIPLPGTPVIFRYQALHAAEMAKSI